MNEKTTKPDADLNARKMEFLDRLTDFAEHANEKLRSITFGSFEFADPLKKIQGIDLHQHGLVFFLNEEECINMTMYKNGDVEIEFSLKPDVLAICVDIPFEHFTSLFENAFDQLLLNNYQ